MIVVGTKETPIQTIKRLDDLLDSQFDQISAATQEIISLSGDVLLLRQHLRNIEKLNNGNDYLITDEVEQALG